MASTADLKNGIFIRFNNDLHMVEENQHRTPGNLRAFYQVKMRSVKTGKITETRFRSGEDIELVRGERKKYSYVYHDGQSYNFMDSQTYDQIPVDEVVLGVGAKYLKEGEIVELMFDGTTVVGADLPFNVNLKVVETVPGVKGDTATGAVKPAKVETGAMVNVPLFINEGDMIKVDVRTGQYLERVKQ